MEKGSALYQLMYVRMHSVMNGIVNSDGEYQAILRKSDIYSGELDRLDLSKEILQLIDRYVSEQNVHSTCAIDPGWDARLPVGIFRLQDHVPKGMPANGSKSNEHRNPYLQFRIPVGL